MPFQLQLVGAESQRREEHYGEGAWRRGRLHLGLGWNHGSQLVQSLSQMPVKSSLGPQRGLLAPNLILFLRRGSGDGRVQGRGRKDWLFWAGTMTRPHSNCPEVNPRVGDGEDGKR